MNKCLETGCLKRVHTRLRCHKHNVLFVEATNPIKCKKLNCLKGSVRNEFCNSHYKEDRRWNLSEPKFNYARSSAKFKGKTWSLSFEDWESFQRTPCHYCDDKLKQATKSGVGLDRLDSSIGYDLNNVVSCCVICNKIKNNYLTPGETLAAVQAIIKFRERKKPKAP